MSGVYYKHEAAINVCMLTKYARQSTCRLAVLLAFVALTPFPGENISWTGALTSVGPGCSAPVVISCSLCEHSAGSTCTQYMGQTFTGCIQLGKASESVQFCKQANTILAFQPSPSVQRLLALLKILQVAPRWVFYDLQRPVFGRLYSEWPCLCSLVAVNFPSMSF